MSILIQREQGGFVAKEELGTAYTFNPADAKKYLNKETARRDRCNGEWVVELDTKSGRYKKVGF